MYTVLSNKLYYNQFWKLEDADLSKFCLVYWLSCGLMFSGVYELRNETASFLSKSVNISVFEDKYKV